ncbi:unnamed protein product [Symbiodinium microadriaticum]|nr:unnamed protein product [Symbiodinium microadriaticum]CAE7943634.1 unnamed protein product [Symbiodinium sp. KB8]
MGGEKRKFDPQRKDGHHVTSKGLNICYDWSRKPDGCSIGKCEKGMAHVCEWCRQPHHSIDCPQVPGWKPEEKKRARSEDAEVEKAREVADAPRGDSEHRRNSTKWLTNTTFLRAKWPDEGTLLGIEEEIPASGVFPVLTAEEQGGWKYRLVHDLRRNGVNSKIKVQERDAIEDAISLFESWLQLEEEVLWLTLDFKNAFKQLPT